MTINIQVIVMLMVVGHFWTPAISLHSRGVTESHLIQQETKRTPLNLRISISGGKETTRDCFSMLSRGLLVVAKVIPKNQVSYPRARECCKEESLAVVASCSLNYINAQSR